MTGGDVTQPETDTETDTETPSAPDAVWAAYAVMKAKGSDVGDFGAWSRTVIAKAKLEHAARAAWLCERYDAPPQAIASSLISGSTQTLEPLRRRTSA